MRNRGRRRRKGLRPGPPLSRVEAELLAWYGRNGRDLPWRRTRDPYAILVSEVMLQQTQVERVVPRYLAWLERWPTVEALAAASAGDVIRDLRDDEEEFLRDMLVAAPAGGDLSPQLGAPW